MTGRSLMSAPSPPFTAECPPIGADSSCGILVVINPDLTATLIDDPDQVPFDGGPGGDGDDTLVGVLNESNVAIPTITLAGSDIFDFDGDGVCSSTIFPRAPICPNGPYGYEGPGTSFTPQGIDFGSVSFSPPIGPGESRYFGLENAVTSANIDSVPHPAHQLTVTTVGSGTVTSAPEAITCPTACAFTFPFGAVVKLTAKPLSGSSFAGWSGDCAGLVDCTISMLKDRSVTATFSRAGPPPPPPGCVPYYIIDTRGSGDPAGKLSSPAQHFVDTWTRIKGAQTTKVSLNSYPASDWKGFANAFLHLNGPYTTSVVHGKTWLSAEIDAINIRCTNAPHKIILLGYSQGAQVTADVYQNGNTANVLGVVLFGDPYFNPADAAVDTGGYDKKHYGSLGRRPRFSPPHGQRVISYCHQNDPVCQFPWPTDPGLSVVKLVAFFKASHAHDSYSKRNEPAQAANALAKLG